MKKSDLPKKEKASKDDKDYEKPVVAKTAYDLQRLKLMKLMKNPEKPILLPDRPKSKSSPSVPEFVRNVMGSSAGAGSGEFHVYRHLRRKEYSRQKFIQEKGRKETMDEEYHRKLEENKAQAEKITAKKRAKRLKKKQRQKQIKRSKPNNSAESRTCTEENSNESDTSEGESDSESKPTQTPDRTKPDDDSKMDKIIPSESDTLHDSSLDFRTKCDNEASDDATKLEVHVEQKLESEKTIESEEISNKNTNTSSNNEEILTE